MTKLLMRMGLPVPVFSRNITIILAMLITLAILSACGGNGKVNETPQTVEGPVLSVASHSITTLTNQDVVVTITSPDNIAAPLGWIKSGTGPYTFTNTYSANTAETVQFKNPEGGITSVPVTITNIDKVGPDVSAPAYSSVVLSNLDIGVTITSSEDIEVPLGWTKSGSGSYTFYRTYSENTTEAVQFKDFAGNITTANIVIANIDKVAPSVSAPVYSTTAPTNGNVTVTITAAENLDAPNGWTKTANGSNFNFTKTYSTDIVDSVTFSDAIGNTTVTNIAINNIDKTPPAVTAPSYTTAAPTNTAVTVSIYSLDDISAPNGWTKSGAAPGLFTFENTYSSNTSETVLFVDAAGNTTPVNIIVNNIDNEIPIPLTFAIGIPTSNSISIQFQSNENGRVYYTIVPAGSPSPTIEQIVNNTAAGTESAGEGALTSNILVDFVASGLSPSSSYEIHYVIKDTAGNIADLEPAGTFNTTP